MGPAERSRSRCRRSPCLLALALAALPLAPAGAVPAAEHTITLNQGTPLNGPGTFTAGGALGQVEGQPEPLAFAHVTGQGTSHARLQYWFRVNGPAPNLEVPIQIDGRIEVSAGNAVFEQNLIWGVSASLAAQALDGPLGQGVGEVDNDVHQIGCNPNSVGPIPVPLPIPTCPATEQEEPAVLELTTRTGADNRVTLLATVNNQAPFAADFESRVDPVISFAPGFDATGYSIEVSDGIANTVPEPSAVAMLPAGAVVLLLMRRRRP